MGIRPPQQLLLVPSCVPERPLDSFLLPPQCPAPPSGAAFPPRSVSSQPINRAEVAEYRTGHSEARMLREGAGSPQEDSALDQAVLWEAKMKQEGMEGERERLETAQSSAMDGKRTAPQDSSTVEEECDATKIEFLPFDFFSGEGGQGAEFATSQEAEEVYRRSQHPAVSMQDQKSSIFPSSGLSIDGEHQIASQCTHFFSEIAHSKSFPSLFAAEQGHVRCLDLSLKLPHSFSASAAAEDSPDDAQGEILENSANACRKSRVKAAPSGGNSRDSSKLISRPFSIILSAGSAELTDMDDSRMQNQIFGALQLDQNHSQETDGSGHGDGLGMASEDNRNDRELGMSWSCPMKKLSSIPAKANATAQPLTAFPGTLSLALPRGFETEIDSEVDSQGQDMPGGLSEGRGKNVSDVGLQVVPHSAYCMESSECDNFGADMITGKIEMEPDLIGRIDGRSISKSEEVDAMSEAGELENGSDEEAAALTLHVDDTTRAPDNANVASHGALDLLVSAIQATSGSLFGEDEDEVSGRLEKGEYEREAENDLLFWSKEASSFMERIPMVKKKVLRRARSAFKKAPQGESNLEIIKGENSEVVDDLSLLKRGRKGRGSADELHETEDDARSDVKQGQEVSEIEVVMDGTPVIRSKRGRSQALPTKFFDSVLQPWKRKSRRKHKQKVEVS